MIPSLSIALPSIHGSPNTTTTKRSITKPSTKKCQFKPTKRHHTRTSSVPSVLPSFKTTQTSKLSMDILLDAIDLDQQMRQFFRSEVVKSKDRMTAFNPSHTMMARRRSKSAPGAPPSYHHQRAFNARWVTAKNETVTSDSQAQQVARMIVQQHFEAVKKR
ncbi:hypothetical protein BDF21DRAFT_432135 [Thamnidium elegans]|uniref:Uncharacterized protein n=1 Tax=Thamnidium elegans TaxID=101142 RepID=A0A8H7SM68_9FUNG|nr:hypothetical protein INT48_003989 [Thamnidium elegans]KAI8051788.1 hypothetical protein BDF21DRAFT_432135 [Thamnidium elegans]